MRLSWALVSLSLLQHECVIGAALHSVFTIWRCDRTLQNIISLHDPQLDAREHAHAHTRKETEHASVDDLTLSSSVGSWLLWIRSRKTFV